MLERGYSCLQIRLTILDENQRCSVTRVGSPARQKTSPVTAPHVPMSLAHETNGAIGMVGGGRRGAVVFSDPKAPSDTNHHVGVDRRHCDRSADVDIRTQRNMMLSRILQWFFRNRQTGAITVAQAPNLVLWIVIIAATVRWIGPSAGTLSSSLHCLSDGRSYRLGGRRDRSWRESLASLSRDGRGDLRARYLR